MQMHSGQIDLTPDAVAGLVAEQFAEWRGLAVRPLRSDGTVSALFRLGDDLLLRFPLLPDEVSRDDLTREQDHCRLVAAHVPLQVPRPVALGEPGSGYPGWWSVYRWIEGMPVDWAHVGDRETFVERLAGFVSALHRIDTGGRSWEGGARGGPLHGMDEAVRGALRVSGHLTDTERLAAIWERCLELGRADDDRWIHADLMPGNLIVRDGRLVAVIDLELVRVGDPALDLMPAWNLFDPDSRRAYRRALDVDDVTWERGRGWAIAQAAVALPYYVETNPVMAETARRTLTAVLG